MKSYEVLEHTADIGIRVKAASLEGLFKKAGLALAELCSEKQTIQSPEKHKIIIRQKAADVEELMINWLNEILSVSAAEGLVFEEIEINQIDECLVDAIAAGSDIKDYKVNLEIKAATYHELKVQKTDSSWLAEVIFDV